MADPLPPPDRDVLDALSRLGLLVPGEAARFTPLTGGVASDIWKAETGGRIFCVKRALEKLRVRDDWRVTVERSSFEVAWIEAARAVAPDAVPEILGADSRSNLFAMSWFPPDDYPVWKDLLMRGQVRNEDAASVGGTMAAIHSATAGNGNLAARFKTDAIFRAIRLDAYLGAAAARHKKLSERLHSLIETTAGTRLALVHGDMSPKNILTGPKGPVFLDAECAWFGDPAFDLAFCLNHLLLKCLWRRTSQDDYLAAYATLANTYLRGVDWEDAARLETRAAHLLPGLLIARVDGKSPVEYLTAEDDKETVRRAATSLLQDPVDSLALVSQHWWEVLES